MVDELIEVNLNTSMISKVTVTIVIDDFDSAHTETDDGSDPDEFAVKINSSGQESQPATGTTPGSVIIELPAGNATEGTEEAVEMGPVLGIHITATCHGGKQAYPSGRPGLIIRGSPFVYVDQGISYTIAIEYDYLEEVGVS
jgi:hypothetical protein